MGYRRSKQQAHEQDRWRGFLQENRDLLARAGVPGAISDSRELFDHFLMHGHVPYPLDPTGFSVDRLEAGQKNLLAEAVVRYLRAGLPDPGLSLFGADRDAELRRRAAGS